MAFPKAYIAFLAALTATVSAKPETHTIQWALPSGGESFEQYIVAFGDTVAFDIGKSGPDVWQFPNHDAYKNCDFKLAKKIQTKDSAGRITVTANKNGASYYASAMNKDCASGLKTTVTTVKGHAMPGLKRKTRREPQSAAMTSNLMSAGINPADSEFSAASASSWSEGRPSSTHVIDWYRPFTTMTELPSLSKVAVNDIVRFWIYDSQGDLLLLPDKNAYANCNYQKAIPLVAGPQQSYDFIPSTPGQFYFASRSFCRLGQKVTVMVDQPASLNIIPGGYVPKINPDMANQPQQFPEMPLVPTMKSFEESITPPPSFPTNNPPMIVPTPTSVLNPANLATETVRVEWTRPTAAISSLPEITFAANSSLLFYYVNSGDDTANVARFRSLEELNNCDFTRAITLNGQYGPYRLNFLSPGDFFFSSTIGDHCRRGLRQVVKVPRPDANDPVTLEGEIYNDANRNEVADSGEGIANVPITYYSDASKKLNTATDQNGQYKVTGLPPGPYTVVIGDIPGFNFPPGTNKLRSFNLLGGTTGTYNFRVLGPAQNAPATIKGNIYNDANQNKNLDAGEGLSGVAVQLTTTQGALVKSVTTDMQGGYTFTTSPGDYLVVINTIAGYNLDSLPMKKLITARPGSTVSFDYSIVGPSRDAEGVIQGTVYNDKNENSSPEGGEGIPGTPVTITNKISGAVVTAMTDSSGVYSATVAPGKYNVNIGDIPGFPIPATVDKSRDVDVQPASTNNYNYAVTGLPANTPGTVSGNIYWDSNANSLNDLEEGLRDIDVTLALGSVTIGQQTTNGTGGFLFTQLEPGTYTVTFSEIPGFNIDPSNLVRSVGVGPGQNAVLDFAITGERGSLDPNGYVSGNIYHDFNDNKDVDANEGLPGIQVTVQSSPDRRVLQTATTLADGSFTFTLPPGEYYVVIGELPGVEASLEQRTQLVTVYNGVTVPFNFRLTGPDPNVPGYVTGTIYSDYNLNNNAEPDEGLGGIKVEIFSLPGNELVSTSETDSAGEFSIPVPPGAYRVTLGEFPGIDVPTSYRVKDVTVPPGGAGKFMFRLTGLPRQNV